MSCIEIGDYVVDPIDEAIREVIDIEDYDGTDANKTLVLRDGGVMGYDEPIDVLLESEVVG